MSPLTTRSEVGAGRTLWRASPRDHLSPPSLAWLLREQYGYSFFAPCLVDQRGNLLAGLLVAEVSSRLTGRRLVGVQRREKLKQLPTCSSERSPRPSNLC